MTGRTRAAAVGVVATIVAGADGSVVRACAACQTGDPTMTAFGDEAAFAGRVRVALDMRSRSDRIGAAGVDRIGIEELRTELGLAWAPTDALFLQLAFPILLRSIDFVDASSELMLASGDLALRARWELGLGFALSAGLSLPTAPTAKRDGAALPMEAQPGTGSVDPALGVAWTTSSVPWAGGVSLWGTWPTGDANPSLRLAGFAQLELWRERATAIAARLAIDARVDGRAYDHGIVERNSGGFVAFVGGDVVFAPAMDWVVTLGVRAPVIDALDGDHHEGVFGVASLAWDP